MKKVKLFLLLPLMTMAVSGCDLFKKKDAGGEEEEEEVTYRYTPEIVGGTEADTKAILETINYKPIAQKVGDGTSTILAHIPQTMSEDNGDRLRLTVSQVYKGSTVKLEWDVDKTQDFYGLDYEEDSAHLMYLFGYKHYGAPAGEFKFKLKKVTCNEAVSNPNIEYTLGVTNESYIHEDATIAECNAVKDEAQTFTVDGKTYTYPSTFETVNYAKDADKKSYSPFFRGNNPGKDKNYLYLNVKGKVVYTAPDGNWGLIGDGNQMLEIYTGAGTDLIPKNFPHLTLGNSVVVKGNMGQYLGNIQLGFITGVLQGNEADTTAPVMTYQVIDENFIKDTLKLSGDFASWKCQKQAIPGFSNSLRQVTGTLVPGSIKNSSNETVTASEVKAGARFSFELQVGSEKMKIAYDYHTDEKGSVGLFDSLKAKLEAGGEMTIKGTARYEGADSNPFALNSSYEGQWTVVPFLADHVA